MNLEFMSQEARHLLLDQEDGCAISPYRNEAPRFVTPRPGGPLPRTRGQVSDAAAQELFIFRVCEKILRYR